MSDQIKHESLKAWIEFTRSNPKKLRKIVITLLYIRYSIWCIKNSKERVDKKTFYKYIACCSSLVVPRFFNN